jgi:adenylate cyclase
MSKFDHFRHKNEMLFANYAATVIGAGIAVFLAYRSVSHEPPQAIRLAIQLAWFFEPFWLILMFVLTIRYERPIRRFLNHSNNKESIPVELTAKARQRLLNEPFFLIALDLCMWISAAVFYSSVLWAAGAGRAAVFTAFSQSIQTGLITVAAAFFLLRNVLQRTIVPQVFPTGGLYMIPKTLRIRISTRLFALLLACNLIPFFAIINILMK